VQLIQIKREECRKDEITRGKGRKQTNRIRIGWKGVEMEGKGGIPAKTWKWPVDGVDYRTAGAMMGTSGRRDCRRARAISWWRMNYGQGDWWWLKRQMALLDPLQAMLSAALFTRNRCILRGAWPVGRIELWHQGRRIARIVDGFVDDAWSHLVDTRRW